MIRHGQTEWNVLHKIQGQLDSPLTQQGKLEAKETAEKFKHIHFDAVFSSDLLRAKHTAEIITIEKKLKIITAKALRERTFGEYDGYTSTEYAEKTASLLKEYKKLMIDEQLKFKFAKGYESDKEVVTRLITFLRETAIAYAGKTVLMITHGGVLRTFLTKLGFAEREKLTPGSLKNAGYILVESDGVDFFLKKVEGIDQSKGLERHLYKS